MPHRTEPDAGAAETDEDLAVAAAGGSRPAFEALVERYGGPVHAALERRLADTHAALDLTQEVWVRVFRSLAGFRPEGSFRSWLFGIALNAARDEGRRRERTPVLYLDDWRAAEGAETPDGGEGGAVRAALLALDEPFRTAVALVDLEGLGYGEAAAAEGCAVGTMKSRVSRGRAAFRAAWERAGGATEVRSGGTT